MDDDTLNCVKKIVDSHGVTHYIDAKTLDGKESSCFINNMRTAYGICESEGSEVTKIVTLSQVYDNWKLEPGAIISIKFLNTNTAQNVHIKINDFDKKPVVVSNHWINANTLEYAGKQDSVITYMYSGTNMWAISTSWGANSVEVDNISITQNENGTISTVGITPQEINDIFKESNISPILFGNDYYNKDEINEMQKEYIKNMNVLNLVSNNITDKGVTFKISDNVITCSGIATSTGETVCFLGTINGLAINHITVDPLVLRFTDTTLVNIRIVVNYKYNGTSYYKNTTASEKDIVIPAGAQIKSIYGNISNSGVETVGQTRIVIRNLSNSITKNTAVDKKQLKILALGDSICRGVRNNGKGFVGDLGLPYKNIGVSSATISNKTTTVKNIPQQLIDETSYVPDIIIANGGINDYINSATLGTIPTEPVTTDTEANALNRNTLTGATGFLFYKMISLHPQAQRFFVIVHKMKRWNVPDKGNPYYPTTVNDAGYTQQDLHDTLVKMCKLYNVKVIDIYDESMLNTKFPQYISNVTYNDDNSITDKYYVDLDGVHPLDLGYKEAYVPLIKQAIEIGTLKK